MAKRKKQSGNTEEADDSGSAHRPGNGFKPKVVKSFVSRIEALFDDIESERSTFMSKCKDIRGDIKEVYAEAKAEGVPTSELKAAVKMRELARKQDDIRDALDTEQQDTLDQIRLALGDLEGTPLGDAAVTHAETNGAIGSEASSFEVSQ